MSEKRLDWIENELLKIVRKSRRECANELKKVNKLIVLALTPALESYLKCCAKSNGQVKTEYYRTLTEKCFIELMKVSNRILALCYIGAYRSAFNDMRYVLESIIQAVYIDIRHPDTGLQTRIEILKEVEDKIEYRAVHLVDKLDIDYKDKLKIEYKKLSRIIHPSHKRVFQTIAEVKKSIEGPFPVDCKEVEKIYDSMKIMYDIFYFLFVIAFSPELKETLKKNQNFILFIKHYNQILLSKTFDIKLN